jgi:hypothetical protein
MCASPHLHRGVSKSGVLHVPSKVTIYDVGIIFSAELVNTFPVQDKLVDYFQLHLVSFAQKKGSVCLMDTCRTDEHYYVQHNLIYGA